MSSETEVVNEAGSDTQAAIHPSWPYVKNMNWFEDRGRLPIIGLAGPFGSGKDEAARGIERLIYSTMKCPHAECKVVRFEDGVREGLMRLDPIIHGEVHLSRIIADVGWDNAKQYQEIQRLMQKFGDEAGRSLHGNDTWVNIAQRTINDYEGRGDNERPKLYVMPDVRYPNEIDFVNNYGLGCIYVERPGINTNKAARKHASESHYEEIRARSKRIIVNDGTVDELHEKARWAASRLLMESFCEMECSPDFVGSRRHQRELHKLRLIDSRLFATDGRIMAFTDATGEDQEWCQTHGASFDERLNRDFVKLTEFPAEAMDESNYVPITSHTGLFDEHFRQPLQTKETYDYSEVCVRLRTGQFVAKFYYDKLLRLPGCRYCLPAVVEPNSMVYFRFGTGKSLPFAGGGVLCPLTSK